MVIEFRGERQLLRDFVLYRADSGDDGCQNCIAMDGKDSLSQAQSLAEMEMCHQTFVLQSLVLQK